MGEADSENQLLDGIVGKYGEDSNSEDLGNADEDALLDDDIFEGTDFIPTDQKPLFKNRAVFCKGSEEPDAEDVLDLVAQEELEDEDEKVPTNQLGILAVSSTTLLDGDSNVQSTVERERNNKFKNERIVLSARVHANIPDSLDEVPVPKTRNRKPFRGRNKNNFGRNRSDAKTVHINPHFKGHVQVNDNARLAWDARQKLALKSQTVKGRRFKQNLNARLQPWLNNNREPIPPPLPPQPQPQPSYQPPPPQPAYLQQPPQVPSWNQFQPPNSFTNQVVQQHCFMQPLPQPPPMLMHHQQYNQPTTQFSQSPVYHQQQQQQPSYNNPFAVPNQYGLHPNVEQPTSFGQAYPPHHSQPPIFNQQLPPPPNFMPPPQQQQPHSLMQPQQQFMHNQNQPYSHQLQFVPEDQYHQQSNIQFRSQQLRFNKPKPPPLVNFKNNSNQGKMHYNQNPNLIKRKVDNADLRKKKRNLLSSNLHEVRTVDIPDTTVKEDKIMIEEDEDDETRAYRKKIEEQKRMREKILQQKEARRRDAAHKKQYEPSESEAPPSKPYTGIQKFAINAPKLSTKSFIFAQTNKLPQSSLPTINSGNVKSVGAAMDNEESHYEKQHLASFLSNRKILTKDQNLIDTDVVVISNLADGTTAVKLRKMCQGIGEIKKLQMHPKERQATIQFNSVASAHEFFKKYQRTILDLSMIQVTLKSMS